MTTTRDFEGEYRTACIADRAPGASYPQRCAAEEFMNSVVEAAVEAADAGDTVAADFVSRVYDIDEAVRLSLYGN